MSDNMRTATVSMALLVWGCAGDPLNDASTSDSSAVGADNSAAQTGSGAAGGGSGGRGGGAGGAGAAGGASTGGGGTGGGTAIGCPTALPGDWIFCEDFEGQLSTSSVFFEHNDDDGDFVVVQGQGSSGDHAIEAVFQQGEVGAGWISVAFGRNPIVGNQPHHRPNEDFDEIYWRVMVKTQLGWPDVGPAKLTRATVFAKPDWGQAMIAHVWSGNGTELVGDPASCVTGSTVDCSGYNDFGALQWLGIMPGQTELYSSALSGIWHCVEAHVRLNTPGQSDGVFELWIDGNLEAGRSDLDWRGGYTDYGLNLVSFSNYWNSGSVAELRRWLDDIVIATAPIGCP